ncbi:DUF2993 domain-containing protein [bacterium]|nr:DUF2993 domain-containing protein [bacterium]
MPLVYLLTGAILALYSLGSMFPGVAGNMLADQIRKQYGPFSKLDVSVVTDPPIRALGGQVDSLRIKAEGFAVEGVPISTASIETDPFHVDTGGALFGKTPTLKQPLEATVSAVLTEDGLNVLLNSPSVTKHLKGIQAQFSVIPGMSVTRTVDIVPGRLRLSQGRLSVDGNVDMGGGTRVPFALSAAPRLVGENQLAFSDIQASLFGSPIPPTMLGDAVNRPIDLSRFEAPGTTYRFTGLGVVPGRLWVDARIGVSTLGGK